MSCFRKYAFSPQNGGRPSATKVMVVVTDGESHDSASLPKVIAQCEDDRITRFGIAVSECKLYFVPHPIFTD